MWPAWREPRDPWRLAPWILGAITLVLDAWQISRLSFTQDEAATMSAIRRPFGAMLAVLRHIDAVHGAYYLIMHLVVRLGQSAAIVRAPSVLATAGTAVLIVMIGTKLGRNWVGPAAGLLFALFGLTTEYAQDARRFALATFLAALASYRFILFMQDGRRANSVWYLAALAACGLMNVFALLIAVAHAVTLLVSPVTRDRLRGYLLSLSAAVIVVAPVAWIASGQVSQVGWEHRPQLALVLPIVAVLGIISALAFVLATAGDNEDEPAGSQAPAVFGAAPLIRLCAPWLVAPVLLLLIASQITIARSPGQSSVAPGSGIWEPRYLLFCLPGAALLVVAMAARLPRYASAAVVAALIIGAAASQAIARPATSRDDLRAAARLIGAQGRPGDAVVFPDIAKRLITDGYPASFRRVRDVGLDTSPAARDSLYGLNVNQPTLWFRLTRIQRVWIVTFPAGVPSRHYGRPNAQDAFCLRQAWQYPLNQVLLYERCVTSPRLRGRR
jgi:mannosyltransferase